MSPAEFCRELEAYLCRKNEGHLIRIVGPVFATVTGWAEQGIPLKVAFRGIDRYFDRQRHAQKARRRPVQIQFCEADILDAFDEWRRAMGPGMTDAQPASASASTPESAPPPAAAARRKPGLQTHVDRVMARLTQRRVESGVASGFGDAIDRILGQLDALRAEAKGARADARERVLATLALLDREMLEAAGASLDAATHASVRAEAARELEPFRSRMAPDAFTRAADAATDRLIRERVRLPTIRVDE
jgi:hypothetical protein